MIRLSLQPSPASETSAFSNIRAFSNRCGGLFPFRIGASSCSRSSALNRTTYLFTEISFAALDAIRRELRRIILAFAVRTASTRACWLFGSGVLCCSPAVGTIASCWVGAVVRHPRIDQYDAVTRIHVAILGERRTPVRGHRFQFDVGRHAAANHDLLL